MNERIRELAQQAEVKWQHQEDVIYSTMTLEQLEKFAELIVRECIHVAVYKDNGIMYTADKAGWVAAGRSNAAEMIKQHFGVEE